MTRRIVTADDVARMEAGSRITLDDRTTLTGPAEELARRRGIEVVPAEGGGPDLGIASSSGATSGAGPGGWPRAAGAVGMPAATATAGAPARGAAPTGASPPRAAAPVGGGRPGTIIVTAVGVNRPGVMAELTAALGDLGGDIQDVSQRITGGYFNAILVVDIRKSGHTFAEFRDKLLELSEPQDYVVTVIDERVFRAMHRI